MLNVSPEKVIGEVPAPPRRLMRLAPLLLVVAAAVTMRAAVYAQLPPRPAPTQNQIYYAQALTAHLGEYLWHTTLKPPLSYLIQSGALRVMGIEQAHDRYGLLLVTFLMDCLAVVLLYLACRRLRINGWLAAAVLAVYSIAYIPFELWWEGAHYDHHTLFFTSLLVYALVRVATSGKVADLLILSLACGLLVAQSTVNALSAPAAAALAALLAARGARRFWLTAVRNVALAAAGAAIVVGGLSVKNYLAAGVVSTSNLAGPAEMMVVQRAFKHETPGGTQRVRDFAVEAAAPQWWLWAYDNSGPRVTPEGKLFGWHDINKAFGICYPAAPPRSGMWPYDYRPLEAKLRELGRDDLADIVAGDIDDARHRPYLAAGYSPELSPRWIAVYGGMSDRIFKTLIRRRPGNFLQSVLECHYIFYNYGSKLPDQIMDEGSRTITAPVPMERTLRAFAVPFKRITRIGYWLAYIGWAAMLAAAIARRRLVRNRPDLLPMGWVAPFAVLAAPALMMAAVFSSVVGTENSRYFMQISPYLIVIVLLAIAVAARLAVAIFTAARRPPEAQHA
ncbi:MAG: hypothetical protein LLG01_05890 [Planctomycetaceae bacterium]|nr:hypothetical protein [Planctomycetaceae bacterium]